MSERITRNHGASGPLPFAPPIPPVPAAPDAGDVEELARVLSGATPEFAARAAENHMTQARRLLTSDWLASLLDAASREGVRIACTNCDADDLGCTACGAQGTLAVTR